MKTKKKTEKPVNTAYTSLTVSAHKFGMRISMANKIGNNAVASIVVLGCELVDENNAESPRELCSQFDFEKLH